MQVQRYPFYIRSTVILFGLILFVYVLLHLADILVPLAFAFIIAMLLNPLVNWLQKKRVPKVLAISVSLFAAILLVALILYFLSSQIAGLSENLPLLKKRFATILNDLQHWLQSSFGISAQKQTELINEGMNSSKALIGSTLNTAVGTVGVLLLLPVYIFLLLYYKSLMLEFLFSVFNQTSTDKVGEILSQTKMAIQSYMVGLLLEASIVAILNSTALLIIGVKYAILLGVLGALLNVLPYIGGLIAIVLPLLMATVTSEGYTMQISIIAAYLLIQFIDNNILVPRIVSSKVKLNALISILAVLLGGALWGVAGMFLSIPAVAILKIIFDRIDSLKPWGKLLGDEIPTSSRFSFKKDKRLSVAEKMVSNTGK
ncbi:MAG TPA: AI-2E family transporter [Flavitalea sp.]|nr:AI-2E family transporter [Flavitalea sp.]